MQKKGSVNQYQAGSSKAVTSRAGKFVASGNSQYTAGILQQSDELLDTLQTPMGRADFNQFGGDGQTTRFMN